MVTLSLLHSDLEEESKAELSFSGTLYLRFADGFARNAVFSNQIDILQIYANLGQNQAQQMAKFLSAICSSTPLLLGYIVSKKHCSLQAFVVAGCAFELLGIALLAAAAAGLAHRATVLIALFVLFALGFGLLTSSLPVLGAAEVTPDDRPRFMQRFYSVLAVGAIAGVLVSGAAQASECYSQGFMFALLVLFVGTVAFLLRSRDSTEISGQMESSIALHGFSIPWPLLILVPFYAAYLQWTTSWYVQALFMDRYVNGFLVPAAWMQVVERLSAILGLLMLQRYANLDLKTRLALGSAVGGLALIVSAAIERARLLAPRVEGFEDISSLSILWTLPQFSLIAVAEALIFPAQTEWTSKSPVLTGLGIAIQALAAVALGCALPFLESWVPQTNPNDGHYDLYFVSLAGGCLTSAVVFLTLPDRAWESSASQKIEPVDQKA